MRIDCDWSIFVDVLWFNKMLLVQTLSSLATRFWGVHQTQQRCVEVARESFRSPTRSWPRDPLQSLALSKGICNTKNTNWSEFVDLQTIQKIDKKILRARNMTEGQKDVVSSRCFTDECHHRLILGEDQTEMVASLSIEIMMRQLWKDSSQVERAAKIAKSSRKEMLVWV